MFAMKFSMEKRIKKFWIAGFFLPAINATVFRNENIIGNSRLIIFFFLFYFFWWSLETVWNFCTKPVSKNLMILFHSISTQGPRIWIKFCRNFLPFFRWCTFETFWPFKITYQMACNFQGKIGWQIRGNLSLINFCFFADILFVTSKLQFFSANHQIRKMQCNGWGS